ncbi:LamG-like jellyroll fold domain-containing protein [Paenibacillus sedimenti]|uniref:Discoidin domain-containing protein n=1 Tax=Paenibacillus sedimenti TaxID=2770274 RepID=A0A926KXQ3_9BACL|nr:LamG-like jellyroll fold domain-containing protein [Paenibacillus sedimenti]MBD0384059.1 discoidin domain-containing protein [Paenibacillus sedimenti]
MSKGMFKPIKKITAHAKRALTVGLISALILQMVPPIPAFAEEAETQAAASSSAAMNEYGYLDKLIFGNSASESAHNFKGQDTSVITGFMGEPARKSNPRVPAEGQGGDLTFNMKVDPYMRNYFTVKFSGEESSSVSMVNINGEQIGYIRNGDYEAINRGWTLPNRFFYNTIMLPLESTVGKESVEITIKSFNPSGNMTSDSRGYYNAYTHTQTYINVDGEKQGYKFKPGQNPDTMLTPDLADTEKQALIDGYMQGHVDLFNQLSGNVDRSAGGKMSIIRYQDELKFYANVLKYSWSPAKTTEEKKAALQRIFKTIDNHVKDYYGNTRLVLRGGHQGDWGGYYGALGEALYIVENLIKDDTIYGEAAWNAYLDQPFVTGTAAGEFSLAGVDWNGGELTRREAWERVLKANFDFARARLSYIYNQVYYTYEGAWEAHEGLRMIGSSFYEGKERSRQILLEALGIRPFLGEEVLVGPNGEELDLYHSLFNHDTQAHFTDDFIHIVGKGLAKSKLDAEGNVVRRLPYGKHYTGLTEAGLTRENGYVANYGEAANYLLTYFYKTLNHAGDEEMNDEILKAALKSIHARGFVRYPSLTDDGKRVMRAEQITDERNQTINGLLAYGTRVGFGMGMQFASLEMAMAQNMQRYSGPQWDEYWQYAREAVGYVQQQLADHQLLHVKDFGNRGSMSGPDFRLAEIYKYVTADRADYARFGGNVMAGVMLPQTDFDSYKPEEITALGINPDDYEQLAWADIDNMYVSVRDGDFRMFGSLFYRNRGMASNGRLRVMKDSYDHIVQIATNNKFRYEDYYLRAPYIDVDFQTDRVNNWSGAPQALAGEAAPASYQPGVGTVNRDNFEVDHPYSGYPELQTSRYGKYLIIFNTTRDEYGNKQTFDVEMPADFTGNAVLDLVSETNIPVVNGKVTAPPKTAMVLKLTSDIELAPKPFHVDFVHALTGNGYVGISWKTTSGGQSYSIKRAETEDGTYETIATGLIGNYYKDTTVQNGKVYYYKVAAVNDYGAGWDSYRAKADLTAPVSAAAGTAWRDDRIGGTSGSAVIDGSSIAIGSVGGAGFGEGDDYNIYKRNILDSLHFVSRVGAGNSSISAKIDSASGEASGVMMRDRLTADKSRYIYFGADENGNLVLQDRTRISIVQWSGEVASPRKTKMEGYTAAEYPYVKLMRDHDSQTVYAFVSKDGTNWKYVTKVSSLLPYAYYTGVAASDQAQFSEVTITETPQGSITPFVAKVQDQVTLHWNKPKQASWFNLYRTTDAAARLADPELKPGTMEPAEGSPWTLVLANTRATSFQESNLRYGSMYYKILPIHGDGSKQPFYDVTVTADPIEVVMQYAESLPASDYTKASFYLFRKELDRIKAEMVKPDADETALINEIYDAKTLLVSARTLLTKVNMDPSMARASEKYWQNDNISEEENAWYLFDENPGTITHTRSAVSWVDVDFGAGNEKVVDTFRYLPRKTHVSRVNGTVFKGSNDGVNWTDLYKIPNTTSYQWYSTILPDPTPYRYIRIYDDHNGFVNFEEIEFLEIGVDKTLLTLLLEEADSAVADYYTADSYKVFQAAAANANAVASDADSTQEDVDAASADLLAALNGLKYINGLPVLDLIGNKFVIAGDKLTFKVQASNANEIVYGATGLPEGATFSEDTRTFEWTPAKEQGGVHTVTFTVKSGELSSSRTIRITVKGLPVIDTGATVQATAKQLFTYQVSASDPSGAPLVYSAANLPAGAAFDTVKGVFTWTPQQADFGSHSVTFTVGNGSYTVSQSMNIEVKLHVLPAANYTKGSHYLYMKEVVQIESAMNQPGADKAQLASLLDQAEKLLVHSSLYSFDGNADNSFGPTHGIVEGQAVYAEGKFGKAIQMNGTDNFVTLPASHPLSASDTITVATWVNWKGGNSWQRIFDFGNDTNQYLFLTPRSGGNTLRFAIKNGSSEQMVETSQLGVNEWVHVAVTLGGGTAKLYVNGELKATKSGFTIKPSDFKPVNNYIGKSQWPDPLLNGMLDEFFVYNYVLSDDEIKAVYNHTAAKRTDISLVTVLLDEAAKLDAAQYTESSSQALETAVANAKTLPADASQEAIDDAAEQLLNALKALNTIPVFAQVPPKTVETGTSVTFSVYAEDKDGDALTYSASNLPFGSSFDPQTRQFAWTPNVPGSYGVTFAVYDARGARANMTVDIQVVDTTAPQLDVVLDKTILWPPNHKLVTVAAQVYGSDSGSGIESIVLTSITSNEPDQGKEIDDDQPNDIQNAEYGTLDQSFSLRAERSGQGTGRVYTVTYTATDKAGNKTVKTVTVTVPHDESGK